jgi:hypothetical protein
MAPANLIEIQDRFLAGEESAAARDIEVLLGEVSRQRVALAACEKGLRLLLDLLPVNDSVAKIHVQGLIGTVEALS